MRNFVYPFLASIPIQKVSQDGTIIHGVKDLSKTNVYFPKGIVQLLDGLYDKEAFRKCTLQYSNLENKNMLRFTGKLTNSSIASMSDDENTTPTPISKTCVYTPMHTQSQEEVHTILSGLLTQLQEGHCGLTQKGFDDLRGQLVRFITNNEVTDKVRQIKEYIVE